ILSETRAEFYLVDVGIMGAGGIAAALYTAYPMADLAQNVSAVGPGFLFVEDPETFTKLSSETTSQGSTLPQQVIVMTGEHAGALSLEALQRLGREALERDASAFKRIQEEISPQDS